MSNCVIKVGKLYYSGTTTSGQENFVLDIKQAFVFDMRYKERTAKALADELGGVLVPLMSSTTTSGRPGVPPEDIDSWIKEHALYILNCTGPTLDMLKDYLAWSIATGDSYDMSSYMGGISCVLRASAFQAGETSEQRFTFAFTLAIQAELTARQLKAWYSSPYGIQLTDGRILLVSSLEGMGIPAGELYRPVDRSGTIVKDTPERRAAIAKWEAECKSSRCRRSVGKMQLM